MKKLFYTLAFIVFQIPSYAQCWISVHTSGQHTLAMKSDSTLWAWGDNWDGELGNGANLDLLVPTQIGIQKWKVVATGNSCSYGIRSNGTLWSWGNNYDYQLGDGGLTDRNTPGMISGNTNWASLHPGTYFVCAMKTTGSRWSWGHANFGGHGDGGYADKFIPTIIDAIANYIKVSTGSGHVLAIKPNGTLWGWGFNSYYQLGLGNSLFHPSVGQLGNATWKEVAAGDVHSMGIKTDGTLWVWGNNDYGKLGIGNNPNHKTTPFQVGIDTNWKSVAASYQSSYAIKSNGTLWAWGRNDNGQLGIGNISDANVPTQVGTDSNWIYVQSRSNSVAALKNDSTLWMWGNNFSGNLGDGTTVDKWVPTLVPCGGIALPIQLNAFDGIFRQGKNLLYWDAATDKHFDRFELEKSRDGIQFQQLSTVAGPGVPQFKSYHFTDEQPCTSITFYRLKAIDKDERFYYSDIISILNETRNTTGFLYPNPVSGTLFFHTVKNSSAYTIYDLSGRILKRGFTSNGGSISVAELVPGVYLVDFDGVQLKMVKE